MEGEVEPVAAKKASKKLSRNVSTPSKLKAPAPLDISRVNAFTVEALASFHAEKDGGSTSPPPSWLGNETIETAFVRRFAYQSVPWLMRRADKPSTARLLGGVSSAHTEHLCVCWTYIHLDLYIVF